MPYVEVGTENNHPVELYYEDKGEGRPIVLIHGWPLSGKSWEPQIAPLIDAGHRVVTYDRRGFGQSSKPWNGYEYDTFASDLDKLLTELDLSDVTLVGFSMGGGEVARYVGNHGTDRLHSVVFAAAVPPFLYATDGNPEGGLDDDTIAQFEGGVKGDRPAFLEGFVETFFTADESKGSEASPPMQAFARQIANVASPKGTLNCINAFGRTDFRDDLAKIDIPTLVIHGDSDQIVPFEISGKRTHESIDGAELALIEGGTHGLNVTQADEFNKALVDFVS